MRLGWNIYILDSTPEGHAKTLEWERDTFCLTFFDSCSPLAHLTPLTLAKVYENLMISSNDEIKDGECGWKQGVDQVTFAEVEVPGFLPAFDLSTLCLFSLKICGHVLTCSPFWLERDASLGGGKWKNESIVLKRRIYSNDLVVGHFLNVMLVLFVSFTLVMSWRRPTSPTESPRTGKERIQRAQERLISVHSPCYSWTVVSCWDEDRANDCHVVCKGASILNELHLQPHFGATWHCTAKHFCWSWVLAVVLQANKQHASRQLQFWCTLVYMPSLVASKYRVKSWLSSTILEGDGAICAVLWWYLKLGWIRILVHMHMYIICIYVYTYVRSHIRIQILYISSWIEVVNSVFGASSDVLMWCETTKAATSNTFLARTSLLKDIVALGILRFEDVFPGLRLALFRESRRFYQKTRGGAWAWNFYIDYKGKSSYQFAHFLNHLHYISNVFNKHSHLSFSRSRL